ncbi:uncharacterized protein LOC62_07G008877 [Vanrija pseudolonga]|uniref:Uncharacterized protein n=1 Tax=Vanrija pseudolonga TaxID=143232 RepID=A0AAF1BTY5_9TREE|nr:hypothetical protein LOC62_07G008877 [Vanrija pseudolonga]
MGCTSSTPIHDPPPEHRGPPAPAPPAPQASSVKTTPAKVEAFQAKFAELLPRTVREVWQLWTEHVPETTSLSIYLAIIPADLILAYVVNGEPGGPQPPEDPTRFTNTFMPIAMLGGPRTRGEDYPARILVRYTGGAPHDKVDVDMTWDPLPYVGASVEDGLKDLFAWHPAATSLGYDGARDTVNRKGGVVAPSDAVLRGVAVDDVTPKSFTWSADFKRRLGADLTMPTAAKARDFDAALARAVPSVVRGLWRLWESSIPGANEINVFAALFSSGMLMSNVAAGKGGDEPDMMAQMGLIQEINGLTPLTERGAGQRGVDFPALLLIRYKPNSVDIDVVWDPAITGDYGGATRKMHDWRASMAEQGHEAAKRAVIPNGADETAVGVPVSQLSARSFQWSENFKARLGA